MLQLRDHYQLPRRVVGSVCVSVHLRALSQPNKFEAKDDYYLSDEFLITVTLLLGLRPFKLKRLCQYQSKVFVCVTVINGHMQIIAQMRSIGFLLRLD